MSIGWDSSRHQNLTRTVIQRPRSRQIDASESPSLCYHSTSLADRESARSSREAKAKAIEIHEGFALRFSIHLISGFATAMTKQLLGGSVDFSWNQNRLTSQPLQSSSPLFWPQDFSSFAHDLLCSLIIAHLRIKTLFQFCGNPLVCFLNNSTSTLWATNVASRWREENYFWRIPDDDSPHNWKSGVHLTNGCHPNKIFC